MERSRGRTGGFDRLKVMAPALSFVRTIVSHGRAMYRPSVGVPGNSPRGVFARGDARNPAELTFRSPCRNLSRLSVPSLRSTAGAHLRPRAWIPLRGASCCQMTA